MKLTKKAKNFLLPYNGERIKLIGIVQSKNREISIYNSHRDKGYLYSITLKDIQAEINGKLGFIKKKIDIYYNPMTSKFDDFGKDIKVEFYIRINIIDNDLYIERPSKIKAIECN